ncbi:glycosyltransferase family 4 protein [Paraburkholderia phenazinium]|uniref:Glycosyltransferase involved in cell wall bisynthesis n=1 Tax=Paraburkholderia phenazinium TaxID=60549 RepID=A0A1G7QCE0_9BURK|nr:glycosyltransferase family 4 protein [Paraburkholderia phenazinium]SDF96186.1 Glycosyltransferase involved in cell wall bisynthesis [Paraburkholderia phenazinium]
MTGALPDRLVIVNDVSIAHGGATALALLEARLMRERGVAVTYATGDDAINPEFETRGIETVGLGRAPLLQAGPAAMLSGVYNPDTVRMLEAWISRHDTSGTIYHVHGWSQILSPSLFTALGRVRERTVITAHDFFLVCPNGGFADYRAGTVCSRVPLGVACVTRDCDKRHYVHKVWRTVRQAVQAHTLRFDPAFPRVLMIHPAMREPLERGGIPAACLQTVPNPVTPWSDTRIAAEHNNEFVFVGRLDPEKGPDLAAAAARRAGVRLVIIGDGPMMPALRAAHPDVTFCGRLAPEEVARRVRSARALLMPSRYPEPYGLVAAEAMWSGLPVIASQSALLATDIVGYGAGMVCDPADEAAFAEAIARIAGDDDATQKMSIAGHTATRHLGLSPDAWAERLLAVFADCGQTNSGCVRAFRSA